MLGSSVKAIGHLIYIGRFIINSNQLLNLAPQGYSIYLINSLNYSDTFLPRFGGMKLLLLFH